ncbi:MAG: amine dehydrogenase large subunit [Gammaproteobacteria bacterium]|nr:amine dehydrogenase large subunit [Gammaproteobacteria bacterium]
MNGLTKRAPARGTQARRLALLAAGLALAASAQAQLPPETIPNVKRIATPYPASYALVHDFAFGSLIDSSFSLVDTESRRFVGMMSAGQFATATFALGRQEFYVGETIHSRGTRGERQDVVAVYDFANLALVAEIDLPPQRANTVVNKANTAVTADERFLLIWNQNPGTSVSVIDLDSRAIVSEVPTPGCALAYPDEARGFIMLCGNGALLSVKLDEAGQPASIESSDPFNDIDADPLSEKASKINGVWHFVSYRGEVQPVDASAEAPVVGSRWWLTDAEERAQDWRPAGWHGTAGHRSGLLWVGMTPDGYPGSHKDPAPEVWLFDAKARSRLDRFALRVPALSIDASGHDEPRLLVVNIEGQLDIYDGRSGAYLRTIGALGETPYMVHAIR